MNNYIFIVMLGFIFSGCSNNAVQPKDTNQWVQQADAIRAQARSQFEQGHPRKALSTIKKALRVSANLSLSSNNLVEIYDDAGLYFYMDKQWKAAARYQAIAVLLVCGQNESETLFAEYIHRLGWAFAAYSPKQPYDLIAKNPLLLMSDTDLNLYKNVDIRRRFFTAYPVINNNKKANNVSYKLNPELLPASCYYHSN